MKGRILRNLPAFRAQHAAWVKSSYRAVLLAEAILSAKLATRMPSALVAKLHVLRVVPMKDRIYRNLPAFRAQPAAWAKGSYRAVLLAVAIQSVKIATRMPSASVAKLHALHVAPMKDRIYHNLPAFRV
jgi:hypothetical protein